MGDKNFILVVILLYLKKLVSSFSLISTNIKYLGDFPLIKLASFTQQL